MILLDTKVISEQFRALPVYLHKLGQLSELLGEK
jgi:hypothetical protein